MNVRLLAVRCLIEIEKGGYSNLSINRIINRNQLNTYETAFFTALVYTTLERQITLEYILSKYLKIPVSSLDVEVLAILECSLAQIHYMDSIPTYAAIDEAVKLTKTMKKNSAAPLVNAVLRRAASFEISTIQGIEDTDEPERLSIAYSLDSSLCELILSQYPIEVAEILKGMFTKRKLYVRVNTQKTSVKSILNNLKDKGIAAETTSIEGCLALENYNLQIAKLIKLGVIRIQSFASQVAVAALAPKPEKLLLDLCAAPGGKTLTAAQLMQNDGTIIALDMHENRLKLLSERAVVEGIDCINCRTEDSAVFNPKHEATADYIIADVPCTGYGEIHTKPELRLKAPPSDDSLYLTQQKILDNGGKYLKKGGRLLYSTCTINRRENEEVVKEFLKNNSAFKLIDIETIEGFRDEDGCMLKLPSSEDGEGFFFAVIEKRL